MFPSLNHPLPKPQSLTASKPRQHLPPPPSPLVPTTFLRTLALLLPRTRTPPDRAHPLHLTGSTFFVGVATFSTNTENNFSSPFNTAQTHARSHGSRMDKPREMARRNEAHGREKEDESGSRPLGDAVRAWRDLHQ